ncbi:MAG: hypothetical protein AAGG07_11235 [Planctomycetota bacterium]
MPTRLPITSLAMTALVAGLFAGCGSTPEPADPQDDSAPLSEPEASAAQDTTTPEVSATDEGPADASPADPNEADTNQADPAGADTSEPAATATEPMPSAEDAFQGSVPAWFSDEPFEFEGKLAVSASGTARTVRDARRAAVDAALAAFDTAARARDMTEGGRVRQTTVAPLPEGGFIAYVLVAAER